MDEVFRYLWQVVVDDVRNVVHVDSTRGYVGRRLTPLDFEKLFDLWVQH